MTEREPPLPWKRIAFWGLILNAVWEFGQCTVLYNMWSWGFWRATVWMWGAILGDIVIVIGVAWSAQKILPGEDLSPPLLQRIRQACVAH